MTDGNSIAFGRSLKLESETTARSQAERIVHFYEEAGLDYEHWSRGMNMHLGLYRWGSNPFDREAMLEELNLAVANRLKISPTPSAILLDLGCGTGAVARAIAGKHLAARIKGVTLSPSQVRIGRDLNAKRGLSGRIEILQDSYANLPFNDSYADGAWAVESACYAKGPCKDDLIREAKRVLKPGGRLVVADCFVTNPSRKFNPLIEKCYAAVCDAWALSEMPTLEPFVDSMERHGFREIVVEDISWRVAPSLAHAPFAVLTFVLKKLLARETLKTESIANLKASLLALPLGLNRSKFSYCLISGTLG